MSASSLGNCAADMTEDIGFIHTCYFSPWSCFLSSLGGHGKLLLQSQHVELPNVFAICWFTPCTCPQEHVLQKDTVNINVYWTGLILVVSKGAHILLSWSVRNGLKCGQKENVDSYWRSCSALNINRICVGVLSLSVVEYMQCSSEIAKNISAIICGLW